MPSPVLDLRSLPQQSQRGGTPGPGLFAHNGRLVAAAWAWLRDDIGEYWGAPPALSTEAVGLGSDPLARMGAAPRNNLAVLLGLDPEMLPDTTLADLLSHYVLGVMADPTGKSRAKPLRMTRQGFKFRLPGFGTLIDEPFSRNHPNFDARMAVRRASYERHIKAGTPREALEKWTGFLMRDFALEEALLPEMIPQVYIDQGHKYRQPSTTITEPFDGTSMANFTQVDPASGGFAEATGVLVRGVSDAAAFPAAMRHDTLLSSDAQYCEIIQVTQPSDTAKFFSPATRFQSDAKTFYETIVREASNLCDISKVVAGTRTVLFAETFVSSWPQTVRLISDSGDNHSITVDGVERNAGGQDTSIQDELQVGITAHSAAALHGTGDSFEAADLEEVRRGGAAWIMSLLSCMSLMLMGK